MNDQSCQICETNKGRYSCPKCYLNYCSVSCYQAEKHLDCSEAFYKKCVEEELKSYSTNLEEKKKMLSILKSCQSSCSDESDKNLDSDDSENELDLAVRMKNVNLDDENDIWEKLTAEEKKEFRNLVASGDIIKIITSWEPWWITLKKKLLIQDCEANDFTLKDIYPTVESSIPRLEELTKKESSPNIPYILVNILASYIGTVRWFKGCHQEMPVESISTIIALSAALRNNIIFISSVEAFMEFERDIFKCEWFSREKYDGILINKDLNIIGKSQYKNDFNFFLKAAISDIKLNAENAIKSLKNGKTYHLKRFTGNPPSSNELRLISKKMHYYLSWAVEKENSIVNAINSLN